MDGTWLIATDQGGATPVSEWDAVEDALQSVRSGDPEYVVIEREKDSEDLFFQVSLWTKGIALGRSFVAEARFPEDNGFRHLMLRTKRFEDIVESARAFTDGSEELVGKWADVTDDYLERRAS